MHDNITEVKLKILDILFQPTEAGQPSMYMYMYIEFCDIIVAVGLCGWS